MEIESKVYLDLARIWNVGPGEVEEAVRSYIERDIGKFKPLLSYSKSHVCIRPVKIKTLKERLEEQVMDNLEIDEEFVKEASEVLDHMDDIIPREEVESLLNKES